MKLPEALAAEVAELTARHGAPAMVVAELPDDRFEPLSMSDRVGEVCMVIRRPGGRLLVFRKTFYPPGVLRLPTGGIRPGEPIAAALLREVAEETSLAVAVVRFLAVVAYRTPATAPGLAPFYSFAFLLDERGGELAVQDLDEQVEAFAELEPADLPALAAQLEGLAPGDDRAIGGSWQSWGRFRAAVHRVVAEQLGAQP